MIAWEQTYLDVAANSQVMVASSDFGSVGRRWKLQSVVRFLKLGQLVQKLRDFHLVGMFLIAGGT